MTRRLERRCASPTATRSCRRAVTARRKRRKPSLEARERSASVDKDAPGRLSADYGLWTSSYTRGELPSMRAHAVGPFLNDAEASPDSPEAGVAHRAAVSRTCWFGWRVSRGAGSFGTCGRFVPTRPRRRSGLSASDMTQASAQCALSRDYFVAARRCYALDCPRGKSARGAAREHHACRYSRAREMSCRLVRIDAWRPCARHAGTHSNSSAIAREYNLPLLARERRVSRGLGDPLRPVRSATELEDMRGGGRAVARTEPSVVRRAIEDYAGWRPRPGRAIPTAPSPSSMKPWRRPTAPSVIARSKRNCIGRAGKCC